MDRVLRERPTLARIVQNPDAEKFVAEGARRDCHARNLDVLHYTEFVTNGHENQA
jgi:hypothetical protein